jgi:hypothetical protein
VNSPVRMSAVEPRHSRRQRANPLRTPGDVPVFPPC